jgi:RNA polymerase sigma-70 factor (ECF subfamily)
VRYEAELARDFDRSRKHLQVVASRMLGSADDADDAVQETWLRASHADTSAVANLTGWLTTIVGRVCLDMLRARQRRGEELTDMTDLEPAAAGADPAGPEDQAVLADSVGLALLVVLDRLGPAERVAFVLHDLFAIPFGEIAEIVGRSPVAAKKLASRARRRLQGPASVPAADVPAADLPRQQRVVEAFLAASRVGDMDALLGVLLQAWSGGQTEPRSRSAGLPRYMVARGVAEETVTSFRRARFPDPLPSTALSEWSLRQPDL